VGQPAARGPPPSTRGLAGDRGLRRQAAVPPGRRRAAVRPVRRPAGVQPVRRQAAVRPQRHTSRRTGHSDPGCPRRTRRIAPPCSTPTCVHRPQVGRDPRLGSSRVVRARAMTRWSRPGPAGAMRGRSSSRSPPGAPDRVSIPSCRRTNLRRKRGLSASPCVDRPLTTARVARPTARVARPTPRPPGRAPYGSRSPYRPPQSIASASATSFGSSAPCPRA
jgi:hypothetical protein